MLVFNGGMDMHKNNKTSDLARLAQPLGKGSVFIEEDDAPEAVTVRPFEYRHPWLTALVICLPTALSTAMLLSLPGQLPLA